MFSIVWNLFALQIWNHYDSDMSGYLDGDEIDAFLRDMLQQQGCSASTQLIKDYKQFIVRFYVLNCNIYVSQIPRRENGTPLEDYGHAVAIPICKCLYVLIRPIPSGAKRIVRSNKIDPQKFQAAINTVGFVIQEFSFGKAKAMPAKGFSAVDLVKMKPNFS